MKIAHGEVEHAHVEAAVRQPPPPEIPEQNSGGVDSLQFMLVSGVLMAAVVYGAVTLKRRQSQAQSETQQAEL